jgi:hypothetical protein
MGIYVKDIQNMRNATNVFELTKLNIEIVRTGRKKEQEYMQMYSKKYHKAYRFRKYGLTSEAYKSIFVKQNKKCAICKMKLKKGKKTCIDHCHNTNEVRGILCWNCNVGLGHLKHNPTWLRQAALYCETVAKGCDKHVSINE